MGKAVPPGGGTRIWFMSSRLTEALQETPAEFSLLGRGQVLPGSRNNSDKKETERAAIVPRTMLNGRAGLQGGISQQPGSEQIRCGHRRLTGYSNLGDDRAESPAQDCCSFHHTLEHFRACVLTPHHWPPLSRPSLPRPSPSPHFSFRAGVQHQPSPCGSICILAASAAAAGQSDA